MLTYNNKIIYYNSKWINPYRGQYHITYVCNGGTVSGPSYATPGDVVSFSYSIGNDWIVDYYALDQTEINSNSFVMPSHDVTVYIYCKLNTDLNVIRFWFYEDDFNPNNSVPEYGWQGTWTQISASPNLWDYTTTGGHGSWEFALGRLDNVSDFEIVGANIDHYGGAWGFFFGATPHLIKVQYMPLHWKDDTPVVHTGMFKDCDKLTEAHVRCDSSVLSVGGLFNGCTALTDVTVANTALVIDFSETFQYCSFVNAPELNTSSVTSMDAMFQGCSNLVSVPLYDTSNVTTMSSTFRDCTSMEELPLFNTHNVTNFSYFASMPFNIRPVTSMLRHVPLYDTSSAVNVTCMFSETIRVESGALDLYRQMSQQSSPPSTYTHCFTDCGINTTTGSAELAQIPSDWKEP